MCNGREECLRKANACVNGARQHDYGVPEDNFALIARLWSEYLNGCGNDICISAVDVANMMVLLKVARGATGIGKLDNYIDIAGYSACAYEMSKNLFLTDAEKEMLECEVDESDKRNKSKWMAYYEEPNE